MIPLFILESVAVLLPRACVRSGESLLAMPFASKRSLDMLEISSRGLANPVPGFFNAYFLIRYPMAEPYGMMVKFQS